MSIITNNTNSLSGLNGLSVKGDFGLFKERASLGGLREGFNGGNDFNGLNCVNGFNGLRSSSSSWEGFKGREFKSVDERYNRYSRKSANSWVKPRQSAYSAKKASIYQSLDGRDGKEGQINWREEWGRAERSSCSLSKKDIKDVKKKGRPFQEIYVTDIGGSDKYEKSESRACQTRLDSQELEPSLPVSEPTKEVLEEKKIQPFNKETLIPTIPQLGGLSTIGTGSHIMPGIAEIDSRLEQDHSNSNLKSKRTEEPSENPFSSNCPQLDKLLKDKVAERAEAVEAISKLLQSDPTAAKAASSLLLDNCKVSTSRKKENPGVSTSPAFHLTQYKPESESKEIKIDLLQDKSPVAIRTWAPFENRKRQKVLSLRQSVTLTRERGPPFSSYVAPSSLLRPENVTKAPNNKNLLKTQPDICSSSSSISHLKTAHRSPYSYYLSQRAQRVDSFPSTSQVLNKRWSIY